MTSRLPFAEAVFIACHHQGPGSKRQGFHPGLRPASVGHESSTVVGGGDVCEHRVGRRQTHGPLAEIVCQSPGSSGTGASAVQPWRRWKSWRAGSAAARTESDRERRSQASSSYWDKMLNREDRIDRRHLSRYSQPVIIPRQRHLSVPRSAQHSGLAPRRRK